MSEAEPEMPQSQQRPRQVAPSLSSLHSSLGINSLLPERPNGKDSDAAAQPQPELSAPSSASAVACIASKSPEVPRTPNCVPAPSSAAPAGPRRPVFQKVSREANPMRMLLGELNMRRELEDLDRMKATDVGAVPEVPVAQALP